MEKLTSRKNSHVTMFRNLLRDKKERDCGQCFVADNVKFFAEGRKKGIFPKTVLATAQAYSNYPEIMSDSESYEITRELSEYISDVKTPQGVFFLYEKQDFSKSVFSNSVNLFGSHDLVKAIPESCLNFSKKNLNRIMMLDKVSDPGNLGSVWRTSSAFGIDGVVLTSGCADEYSPKALRGSMGAVFHTPIFRLNDSNSSPENDMHDFFENLKKNGFKIYAAILDDTAQSCYKTSFSGNICVILGNEGSGISPEIESFADTKIYIPIKGIQSLGVAAAAAALCAVMNNIDYV